MKRGASLCLLLLAAGAAQAEALPIAACGIPAYSAEMKRYELEGQTRLALTLDVDGKVGRKMVARSSGWQLLDEAALKLVETCRFDYQTAESTHTLDVNWSLPAETRAPVRPALIADSCKSSPLLGIASETVAAAPDSLLLRLQVWSDGAVYSPKLEGGSGIAVLDQVVLAYAQSCRYTPARRDEAAVAAAAVLRVGYRRALLEDANLRSIYERFLPAMLAYLAGREEYHSAHILLANEADARAVLGDLQQGLKFEPLAVRWSRDRGGKDGGDLGWALPETYTPTFDAALRQANAEGVIPAPVKTPFGWHVIRILGVRPAQPPSFEHMRNWIKTLVIRNEVERGEQFLHKAQSPLAP